MRHFFSFMAFVSVVATSACVILGKGAEAPLFLLFAFVFMVLRTEPKI